nr:phBC6A51 family helix-turn-helix protein [Enterococcus sp. MJM12]
MIHEFATTGGGSPVRCLYIGQSSGCLLIYIILEIGGDNVELKRIHQKAIVMLFEGDMTRAEIASQLQIAESTLYNWLKDDDFSKAYDDHVKTIMSKSSGKALNTMLSLLSAKSEMVRFNAAKDIMDRGGLAPIDKKEIKQDINFDIVIDDWDDDDA